MSGAADEPSSSAGGEPRGPGTAPVQGRGVRCVRGCGLGIEDARGLRIEVVDGALTVRRPQRPPEVVASLGSVRRVVWVDAQQAVALLSRWPWSGPRPGAGGGADGGAVLVLGHDAVHLAFLVDDVVPWGGEPGERRDSSGAVGLARALGLVLEAARPEDIPPRARARAALVRPQQAAEPSGLWALGLTLLAGVLAFLTWPYGGSVRGVLLGIASLATIAPVLALLVRCRRRFDAVVGAPPDPEGRAVLPLSLPGAQLQVGEHDVVLVDPGGEEIWLPGPAAAGVTACVVGESATCFFDARGALLMALADDQLAPAGRPSDRLTEVAGPVGIEVSRDPFLVPAYGAPLDPRKNAAEPGALMTDWERGRIGMLVDVLLPFAGVIHLGGALAAAYSFPPWGYPLLVGSLAWLGVRAWAGWGYRRWRAGIRQRGVE